MISNRKFSVKILSVFAALLFFSCLLQGAERNNTISAESYNQIKKIQTIINDKDFEVALSSIDDYLNKKGILNYENALGLELKGQLLYTNGQLSASIIVYRQILILEQLPDTLLLNTRRTLCQLLITARDYDSALLEIAKLEKIVLNDDAFLLFLKSHVFLMQEKFSEARIAISAAIRLSKADSIPPKEDWLKILYTCFFHQGEYENMVATLRQLLELYPKAQYAYKLGHGFNLTKRTRSQLVILETLNDLTPFLRPTEISALANLHLLHETPYKAAKILESGIDLNILESSEKNLQLLSYAWLEAKETQLALKPLARAASMSSHGNLHLQLAQLFINQEKWTKAADWLTEGIKKGNLKSMADANIMLGVVLFNQKKLAAARLAFIKAIDTGDKTITASKWIERIDNL